MHRRTFLKAGMAATATLSLAPPAISQRLAARCPTPTSTSQMAQFCNGRFGQGNAPTIDGSTFNSFQIPYPDKLAAGCTLFLALSFDNTDTISTIADNINGSWLTTPIGSVVGANSTLALFAFPGSGAANPDTGNALFVTVTYTANGIIPVSYFFAFSGIKTTSPQDGGSGAASQTTSGSHATVSCGSFTPTTNNDAYGGHLILSFFCLDGNCSAGSPTTIAASPDFTLMSADIGWATGAGIPKASAYQIQATNCAINPGATLTSNEDDDTWNCLAAAFLIDSIQGAPPTDMYVAKYSFHFVAAQQADWSLQMPLTGTTPVVAAFGAEFTNVTDSQGNTWTFAPSDSPIGCDVTGQIWYTTATPDPDYKVILHRTSPPLQQSHAALYDLVGGSGCIGANTNQPCPSFTFPNCPDNPDITPTQAGSIIVLAGPDGIGPVVSLSNPTSFLADVMVIGTNNDDSNTENSGDGWGHGRVLANMVGVSQNVTWTVGAGPDVGAPQAHAVEFLPLLQQTLPTP